MIHVVEMKIKVTVLFLYFSVELVNPSVIRKIRKNVRHCLAADVTHWDKQVRD